MEGPLLFRRTLATSALDPQQPFDAANDFVWSCPTADARSRLRLASGYAFS